MAGHSFFPMRKTGILRQGLDQSRMCPAGFFTAMWWTCAESRSHVSARRGADGFGGVEHCRMVFAGSTVQPGKCGWCADMLGGSGLLLVLCGICLPHIEPRGKTSLACGVAGKERGAQYLRGKVYDHYPEDHESSPSVHEKSWLSILQEMLL